jgi:hypothetical protein
VEHKNINEIIIILNIKKDNTNTTKTLSTIFSFNINDLAPPPSNMTFLPLSSNFPYGLGIINLDNGRELIKNNNNNK